LRASSKNDKIGEQTRQSAYREAKKMAKYFGYAVCILVALFFLEWFQIIDIPFVDIPDFTSGKKVLIEKSEGSLSQRLGD
jgi:hypothetical protein